MLTNAFYDIFFCFQWVPEISHHCQKTPFLLVGTQIDLRDDAATIEKLAKNKQKPISFEQVAIVFQNQEPAFISTA